MLYKISAFKSDFSVILGDFNARTKFWYKNDNTNTNQGTKINAVSSSYQLQQLISQLNNLLTNFSTCIDPIFTDQTSLVVDCGNQPSLYPKCLQQNICCSFAI